MKRRGFLAALMAVFCFPFRRAKVDQPAVESIYAQPPPPLGYNCFYENTEMIEDGDYIVPMWTPALEAKVAKEFQRPTLIVRLVHTEKELK